MRNRAAACEAPARADANADASCGPSRGEAAARCALRAQVKKDKLAAHRDAACGGRARADAKADTSCGPPPPGGCGPHGPGGPIQTLGRPARTDGPATIRNNGPSDSNPRQTRNRADGLATIRDSGPSPPEAADRIQPEAGPQPSGWACFRAARECSPPPGGGGCGLPVLTDRFGRQTVPPQPAEQTKGNEPFR